MKKIILLTAICLTVLIGCKKSGYNCQQKVTTTMIPDSTGFPQIQFSEFQLKGSSTCVIGTSSSETVLGNRVKVVKYETTCN
ncbi:MAG: hypothetical protein WCL06_12585 [Bacteroidota bacterium]